MNEADVADLLSQHRQQMDALIEGHQQHIINAQQAYQQMVMEATQQIKDVIAGAQHPAPKVEPPQAVWSDGYLVLNRPAAELVDDLLSRTGEVLSELGKLMQKAS